MKKLVILCAESFLYFEAVKDRIEHTCPHLEVVYAQNWKQAVGLVGKNCLVITSSIVAGGESDNPTSASLLLLKGAKEKHPETKVILYSAGFSPANTSGFDLAICNTGAKSTERLFREINNF
ncbi:MAG: hypothetical protein WCQ32_00470 [bacterium]